MFEGLSIGVVIPARDEEAAIGKVVTALRALRNNAGERLLDEIVVTDNGSRDCTAERARRAGARVVSEPIAGYGRACLAAIAALSKPGIVLFVDGDASVDPSEVAHLVAPFSQGVDLVVGSRTLGHAEAGALSLPQCWGNRLATFLIRKLWGRNVTDLGPFRAVRREVLETLGMADLSFGWTVEMQVKAIQYGYVYAEVPVSTRVRIGRSKISGTMRGVISAGMGILCMIGRLWWQERCSPKRRAASTL